MCPPIALLRAVVAVLLASVSVESVGALPLRLELTSAHRPFTFSGAFPEGILTLETASSPIGPWNALLNQYTSNAVGQILSPAPGPATGFYRTRAWDIMPAADGVTGLLEAYGLLTTVAGAGGVTADVNKWDASFEGGLATDALLSNPHFAMADGTGNIYIADKQAHAIRKVLLDGTIVTAAGTGKQGDGTDKVALATTVDLDLPNGLWVKKDGTVYILDTSNNKVRRLDPDGTLKTLFSVSGGIDTGRGLWVSDDEKLAYVASGTVVKRWKKGSGVSDFAKGFVELGNLVVDPQGKLVVTDRGGSLVYRIDSSGSATPIAGNGTASGGGDGSPALETGLLEVRGIWFLPNGSYFLVTHHGSQMWYVDTDGIIHLFLNGARFAHSGDDTYFYAPEEFRLSEIRAVTMDFQGNLLITENDAGFVRKVQFLPMTQP